MPACAPMCKHRMRNVCAASALVMVERVSFDTTHHHIPPIFSWGPSIFENLPHTLVEQKNGAFEGEKGSPNAFLRDLYARNLSRARNQQSAQLISCLDIINTK